MHAEQEPALVVGNKIAHDTGIVVPKRRGSRHLGSSHRDNLGVVASFPLLGLLSEAGYLSPTIIASPPRLHSRWLILGAIGNEER